LCSIHLARIVGACFARAGCVDHRWRGGDQIKVVFAGEALLDDLQVEQAQEAAAKAEAQRGAGFHLEAEAGIVEPQLGDRFAQAFSKSAASTGNSPQNTTGCTSLKPGSASASRAVLHRGDGIADAGLRHFLDLRGDEADLAGADFVELLDLGPHAADAVDQVFGAACMNLTCKALADRRHR
jgi:hypothetical protein